MSKVAQAKVEIKSTEFQPKKDFLLVKPEPWPDEKVSEGGIIMLTTPKSVNDRPTFGEVQSIGEKIEDINIGDFVMWPVTDGLDMEFTDGEFLLLRYESIVGIKKTQS